MPKVEIRVRGVVGRVLTAALASEHVLDARAETVLTGRVSDEAELHGLLNRIRVLGLDLVGVHVAVRDCCSSRPGAGGAAVASGE